MSSAAQDIAVAVERAIGPKFLCPICNQLVHADHNTDPDNPCEPNQAINWIASNAWRYLMGEKGPTSRAKGYGVR